MALQEELESQGNWLFRYRSFLPLLILVAGWGMYLRRVLHPEEFPLFVSKYELYYWIVAMAPVFIPWYDIPCILAIS